MNDLIPIEQPAAVTVAMRKTEQQSRAMNDSLKYTLEGKAASTKRNFGKPRKTRPFSFG
jgi:hypothetical protein